MSTETQQSEKLEYNFENMRTDWLLKEKDSHHSQSHEYQEIKNELDRREPLENRQDFEKIIVQRNFDKSWL